MSVRFPYRRPCRRRIRVLTRLRPGALVCLASTLAGCGSGDDASPPPAVVENPVNEADLTTVRLSEEAAARIGIEVGVIGSGSVQSRLTLPGELIAVPGSSMILTAPRAATVLAPGSGPTPSAGSRVAAGQALFGLAVLAADPSRTGEDVSVAEARLENARAKAERAHRLLDEGVASRAQAEDADAELRSAEAATVAARSRLAVQRGGTGSGGTAQVVRAPRAGWVQSVYVAPGQAVGDGAPLLELVDPDPLWVRVPVYVGDLDRVDRTSGATVLDPGASDASGRTADPVDGPRTANAAAASADLFYRVANGDGAFRPGQRVNVLLSLGNAALRESVVPWSAILHDIQGGTWVYEARPDHVYVRRRVEVRDVQGDVAVLRRAPPPGTPVVVVGAAELFSTEFGTSH